MVYECKHCSFRSRELLPLVKHMFEVHSVEPRFTYTCSIKGCPHTFRTGATYSSFVTHAKRTHPNWRQEMLDDDTTATPAIPPEHEDPTIPPEHEDFIMPPIVSMDDDMQTADEGMDIQRTAAIFLLTLKEKYRLTQSAVDFAVGYVRQMLSLVCEQSKRSVTGALCTTHQSGDIPDLTACFEHADIFSGLETEYLQTKFYKSHFNLVEPVTVELGTTWSYQKSGTKRRLVEKRDTFQYVPLIPNLEALMQNPQVYEEICKTHARNDGHLADFCDGSLYQSHPLFASDPHALQLVTYYDDVEVCNPLGAHHGVHKLALFYYVLGNISPSLRSTLRSIQLIACVTHVNLQKYGFQKILQPFIDDVKSLAEGVEVTVQSRTVTIQGTVLVMLADTLAAHSVGGFKAGVGFALRKCRDCLATGDTMSKKFRARYFTLRDPSSYDYHCSLLNGPLAQEDSVTYGINFRSPLNDLPYFHVANSQLPQDVMHVLLEGTVPMETKLLFINIKHYFSLDQLNERLRCFPFSQEELRDKPTAINQNAMTGGSLSQSAAQMWLLATYLPLIVGDRVPLDNPHWECYLLLLDIIQICTSRIVSSDLAGYLEALIEHHHQTFVCCYPGVRLTPKQHYMVHFPSLLLKLGPLVNAWCMRMEAKNSYFKSISQIGNFKNIAYSVAKRHQLLLCAQLQSQNFLSSELECGAVGKPVSLREIEYKDKIYSFLPDKSKEYHIYRPKWVKCNGEVYRSSAFLLTGWQEDDLPAFSSIQDIMVVDKMLFFVVCKFTTVRIDRHFHSFVTSKVGAQQLTTLNEVVDTHPLYGHYIRGNSFVYITMRSHVQNT